MEVLNGTVDLRRKKHEEVVAMLTEKGYDKLEEHGEYKYLTKMPMDSVTEENVEKLLRENDHKQVELENIKKTTIYKMWMDELETLNSEYLEYRENRERLMNGLYGEKPKKVVSKGPLNKSKNKNLVISN